MRSLLTRYLTYIFILFSCPLRAQEYLIDIKMWGINDGLSDRQVCAICKDNKGFIWLGTRNGLNCFDGYTFKAYTKEKKQLPFHRIDAIIEDKNHMLWLLSATEKGNNLAIFDPEEKKYQTWKDKTGYKRDETFGYLQKLNDSVIFFGNDTCFFTWQPHRGLQRAVYPVKMMTYIGTSDHSTLLLVDSTGRICETDINGKLLRAACKSNVSQIKMAFSPAALTDRFMLNTDVHFYNDSVVFADVCGDFSCLVRKGVYTGVDSLWRKYYSLFEDKDQVVEELAEKGALAINEGAVWIPNPYGLNRVTVAKNKFRKYFYKKPPHYEGNSFRNLLVSGNHLFAMNENQGLYAAATDTTNGSNIRHFLKYNASPYYCFTQLANDSMLIVTRTDLYTSSKDHNTWVSTACPLPSYTSAWTVYQVSADSFLLGTSLGLGWLSLTQHHYQALSNYGKYPELASALVLDIICGNNGNLWLCANKGLYEYNTRLGVINRYSPDDTGINYLPSAEVQHLHQDAAGVYWIATANGLIRWDKEHHASHMYTHEDGLTNNNIYAVYEDHKNRLWLSSDMGIMEFNKQTGRVKSYLTDDGITNTEFNRISHTRDSAGNIYFGSINGVTSFNPDSFPDDDDDAKRATLAVSSLIQFDGGTNRLEDKTPELLRTNTITLQPGDRFFNLNISLLTFNDVLRTTYYWKIEGIDTSWNSMHEPTLRISGLPYGKRTLRIKAEGYDGRWGKNELLFTINVIRPVYLRTWFIVTCVIVLILITWGIFRWRTYLLRRENERLDKVVKEKTTALEDTIDKLRISSKQKDILMKEIHHRVKNNLQVISTLLDLQLTKIDDDVARKSIEESISRISSIALVHYYLYKADRLTAIEMSQFAKELFEQVSSVYHQREQGVRLICNIPETNLDIDTALPLGLILNELMTNSFKYAFADCIDCKIDITLTHTGGTFTLQYCDFGPGLPEDYDMHKAESLGMTIIKSLSKQLGGDFSYRKEGNCFVIHFLDAATRKSIA